MSGIFVSYDGVLDPLGSSQVLPYVLGLAERRLCTTLITFEKRERLAVEVRRAALADRLHRAGVRWRSLEYHKRPRVPATLWDVIRGALALRAENRRCHSDVVHCRGDVAMWMARLASLGPKSQLLYDIRGFFADERVESGSWKGGSLVDRAVRRVESANLRSADAVVVLTRAALPVLAKRRALLPPHRVIPTCVDLARFQPRLPGVPPDIGLIYAGALGTWYMVEEMVRFARIAMEFVPGRVVFLTPDIEIAEQAGVDDSWADLRSALPEDVPEWLRRARAAFFFIRPTPAKRASCPTKLGEALASGLPVITNSGIGDVDGLLDRRSGVVLSALSDDAYRRASEQLRTLIDSPATTEACRRLARERLGLDAAIDSYRELYETLHDSGLGKAAS